jgi:hypothetical protein
VWIWQDDVLGMFLSITTLRMNGIETRITGRYPDGYVVSSVEYGY